MICFFYFFRYWLSDHNGLFSFWLIGQTYRLRNEIFFLFSLGWRVFRDHFGLELCMMKPLMYCWKTPEVAGLLESWLLRTLLKKPVFPCVYTVGTVLTSVWQNPLSDKDIFSYFPFAKCSLNARWTKVIFIFRENVFFCNKSVWLSLVLRVT